MESQFVISVIAVAIVANFVTYVHPTPVDGRIIRSILINSTSPTTMRPISGKNYCLDKKKLILDKFICTRIIITRELNFYPDKDI